jgi:Co/Zn/Cd efflux system component
MHSTKKTKGQLICLSDKLKNFQKTKLFSIQDFPSIFYARKCLQLYSEEKKSITTIKQKISQRTPIQRITIQPYSYLVSTVLNISSFQWLW